MLPNRLSGESLIKIKKINCVLHTFTEIYRDRADLVNWLGYITEGLLPTAQALFLSIHYTWFTEIWVRFLRSPCARNWTLLYQIK